jgi:hypothetical protein
MIFGWGMDFIWFEGEFKNQGSSFFMFGLVNC